VLTAHAAAVPSSPLSAPAVAVGEAISEPKTATLANTPRNAYFLLDILVTFHAIDASRLSKA
jgi:hypothetical protein